MTRAVLSTTWGQSGTEPEARIPQRRYNELSKSVFGGGNNEADGGDMAGKGVWSYDSTSGTEYLLELGNVHKATTKQQLL